MVIIAGQKYACERCIRGHRVSQCTHTSEDLNKINPKGRPSSHCSHCKSHRRNRNAHVKCSCRAGSMQMPGAQPDGNPKCHCQSTKQCICSSKARIQQASTVEEQGDPRELRLPEKILAGGYEEVVELARKIYGPSAVAGTPLSSLDARSNSHMGGSHSLSSSVDGRRPQSFPMHSVGTLGQSGQSSYYGPPGAMFDPSAPLMGGLPGYPAPHPSASTFYAASGPYGPPPPSTGPGQDGSKPIDTYYGSIGLSEEPRYSRPLLPTLEQKATSQPQSQPAPHILDRKPLIATTTGLSEAMVASGYPDSKSLEQRLYARSASSGSTVLSSLERFEEQTDDEFWQWLANGGRATSIDMHPQQLRTFTDTQIANYGNRYNVSLNQIQAQIRQQAQAQAQAQALYASRNSVPEQLNTSYATPPVSSSTISSTSVSQTHPQQQQQQQQLPPQLPGLKNPFPSVPRQQSPTQAQGQVQGQPQSSQQQTQQQQQPQSLLQAQPQQQQISGQPAQQGQPPQQVPASQQQAVHSFAAYPKLPRIPSQPSPIQSSPQMAQPLAAQLTPQQQQLEQQNAQSGQSQAQQQQVGQIVQPTESMPGSVMNQAGALHNQTQPQGLIQAVPLATPMMMQSAAQAAQSHMTQSGPPQQHQQYQQHHQPPQPLQPQASQQQQQQHHQQHQQQMPQPRQQPTQTQQHQLPPSPGRIWDYSKQQPPHVHGISRQPSPPQPQGQIQPATIAVPVQPQQQPMQ